MGGLAAIAALLWIAVPPSRAAVIREDFSGPPAEAGWRQQGDPALFAWNPGAGRLEATWDSSRSNTFLMRPLGTVLTRGEDVRFACTLALDEIRTGSPDATFQLAIGLLRQSDALRTNFYRGAGVNPAWGPRNLLEFDYFPASRSITPTFSAVAVATNNLRWAMANLFPFELTPGDRYRIELAYTAGDRAVRLAVARNGIPWCSGSTRLDDRFGDFRLDAFSITSYSGDHQPAGYGGQLFARGWVDDVEVEFPDPPAPRLEVLRTPGSAAARVRASAVPGWVPRLERSVDLRSWEDAGGVPDTDGAWEFAIPGPSSPAATLFRLRLERP